MKSLRDRIALVVQNRIIARLQGLSVELADQVIAEFKTLSVSDLFAGTTVVQPASASAPAKFPAKVKPAKTPRPKGAARFNDERKVEAVGKIVQFLKTAKKPLSSEEILAEFNQLDKPQWQRVSKYMRAENLVTARGEKREMTFEYRDPSAAPAVVANGADVAGTEIDKPAEMLL